MAEIHLNKKEIEKLKKFVYFLKKNNIYEQYVYNLNKTQKSDGHNRMTIPLLIRYYSMGDFIYEAFYFDASPEGSYFWHCVSSDWLNFMYYSWDSNEKTYNNPLTRWKKINEDKQKRIYTIP